MKKGFITYILIVVSLVVNAQNCIADYTYNDNGLGELSFQNNSETYGNPICTYSWDFGDGFTSSLPNPNHQYDTSGTYTVCLSIEVGQDSTCTDIICSNNTCQNINVTVPPPCNLNINYTQINVSSYGGSDGSIDLTVSNGANPYSYNWNTGQTLEDISNLMAGVYSVTVTDTLNCQDSVSITITEPAFVSEFSLSGYVYAKTALLPEGVALLIDSNNTVIAKTEVNSGLYQFLNIDSAVYSVYAVPYFDLNYNYFPIYFPTYLGDSKFWQSSNRILVDSIRTADIHLNSYEEITHGQGFISGHLQYEDDSEFESAIYQQNWFSSFKLVNSQEASNVTVLLMTEDKTVIDYCLSDVNGNYQFDNIPYGNYFIYAEKSGKTMNPVNVYLSQERDSLENINLTIEAENIISVEENKIKPIEIRISPNPFMDKLQIRFAEKDEWMEVSIIDINGRKVFFKRTNHSELKINTESLQKGVYLIYCKSGSKRFVGKIIK